MVHQHTPGEDHEHDHDSERESPDPVTHQEGEAAPRVNARPLIIALAITTIFLVVEVVGAYLSNSLALLADAAHMLTDVAALGLALLAIALARRPATATRSFGYLRAEILAALINAVTLIVAAIYIFYEAWERLQDPPEVQSNTLLLVAIAGLLANIASAFVLSRGGGHEHNLNQRGAFLHVLGDLFGSVATIIAALIIKATGWYAADPILSAVIGLLVVYGAWSLLRESVDVLLESAPRGMDVEKVRRAMLEVPGVLGATVVEDVFLAFPGDPRAHQPACGFREQDPGMRRGVVGMGMRNEHRLCGADGAVCIQPQSRLRQMDRPTCVVEIQRPHVRAYVSRGGTACRRP